MHIPTRNLLLTLLKRGFSTSNPTPTLRCINTIPPKYKPLVLRESRKALAEYLHATKSVPFFFAEQIASNSLFGLAKLIRTVEFSVPAFPERIRNVLRYQAVNEFEFFFESIGIGYGDIDRYLPRDKFFLSDDGGVVLEAATALCRSGFPWNMLGKLYAEKVSIFSTPAGELTARLCGIRERRGFHNSSVVGACLAFPCLLAENGEFGGDFESLFDDLKWVFKGFDDGGSVDGRYEICCKLRFFYELGCERGKVGEFMFRGRRFFIECPKRVLEDKVNYFCKFDVSKDKVGLLLLRYPEVLGFDLESPVISVYELLEHFGMDEKEMWYLSMKYPHIFGRNKMANLPNVTRALELHEWFFDKIENSGCRLLLTYSISHPDRDIDRKFQDAFNKIKSSRLHCYAMSKLDFLTGIGFGENFLTINLFHGLQAASSGLQERFDYLIGIGIRFSEVCSMLKMAPRIFCRGSKVMEKKVNYLCEEMGSSIEYLDCFPRFLLFDLESRIKPRHRFYVWLRETGLCTKNYSIQSLVDASEKRFIARIFRLHPAAPKRYLECYLPKCYAYKS